MKNAEHRKPAPRPPAADRIDVDVVEKNTETSWALFEALRTQHQRGFERTAAAGLESVGAPAALRPAELTLDDVLVEIRRNNRVCPLPKVWQRLYDFLPNKGPSLSGVPDTPEAWARMSSLQKRSRFRSHIEWAAAQGVLKKVHEALLRLPEDRWYHMGQ